jgi:peptide/nickel transport system substrate-binding protein
VHSAGPTARAWRVLPVAVLAAGALALASCGGGDDGAEQASGTESSRGTADYTGEHEKAPASVTTRLEGDWPHFDFQKEMIVNVYDVIIPAHDRLVARNDENEIVPYLAESWEESATSIVFTLRDDATCADGTPVTPTVVKDSFERLINVEKTSDTVSNLFGPGPFSVSADDQAGTFTFTTETPFRNLLNGFTLGGASVICPEGLANEGELETKMFGSGPYELVSAKHGDQISFKLREDYDWGPPGYSADELPRELTMKVVGNLTTTANLISTGGLDIGQVGGRDIDRLAADDSLVHVVSQNFHSFTLLFNQFNGRVTNDKGLRLGLMHAVDPNEVNEAAFGGHGKVSPSLNGPGSDCYDEGLLELAPAVSFEEGRAVLEEAGYRFADGRFSRPDGSPLKLRLLTNETMDAMGEYLATQFEELGVDIDLANLDDNQYAEDLIAGNFDMAVLEYDMVSPVPGPNLTFVSGKPLAKGGFNLANTGGGDPKLDTLVREAVSTPGDEGCERFQELNRYYLEQAYLYPMVAPSLDYFAKGWDFLPRGATAEPFSLRKRAE